MTKGPYDEMTPEDASSKERDAVALRDNALLAQCLDFVEDSCVEEFKMSQYENRDARERAWAMIRATNELRRVISAWISTGSDQGMVRQHVDARKKK